MRLKIGPATLVSAAFIGPGTVITCSIAGVKFGYSLAWALVFSVVTTIILQEMAGRITLVRGKSLSEILRTDLPEGFWRSLILMVAGLAIWIGNAAYQSGNLTGASMGLQALSGSLTADPFGAKTSVFIVSCLVFGMLYFGKYKILEKVFIALVILMSLVFIMTLFYVNIDWGALLFGLVVPSAPGNSIMTILALIGTTVVPYNLFLHSNAVLNKGWDTRNLSEFRLDLWVSVTVGGFISISILAVAAATILDSPDSLLNLSRQLQPFLGENAEFFFSLGIFSAGITSSITAPIAASYTVCGLLGKPAEFTDPTFRYVWISVVATGMTVSLLDFKPILVIQFAQLMNGILLPSIAIIIFILLNSAKLGKYRNSRVINVLTVLIIGVVLILTIRTLLNLFT